MVRGTHANLHPTHRCNTHTYIYTYGGQQLVDVPHHVVDALEPVGDVGARRRLVAGEEGACFVLEF